MFPPAFFFLQNRQNSRRLEAPITHGKDSWAHIIFRPESFLLYCMSRNTANCEPNPDLLRSTMHLFGLKLHQESLLCLALGRTIVVR